MGGFSIWHWLVVLLIVALIFGTKRLGNIGSDVGNAVKSFKKAMQDDDKPASDTDSQPKIDKPADPSSSGQSSSAQSSNTQSADEQRERDQQRPGN